MSNLKLFLKPDKEKITISAAIIALSILLIAFGIYFTRFQSLEYLWFLPGLFFIVIYYFYLPVTLVMGMMYSLVPWMNTDIDTMTPSQFTFFLGLRFVLSCVYAYVNLLK